MTEEEKLEKIVGVMINQPMEGLLYDLDLLPEQCGNDRMNMRRIVVERQAIKIKKLEKEKEWLEYKVLEASQKQYPELSLAEKVVMLEDDMQQALKEK